MQIGSITVEFEDDILIEQFVGVAQGVELLWTPNSEEIKERLDSLIVLPFDLPFE